VRQHLQVFSSAVMIIVCLVIFSSFLPFTITPLSLDDLQDGESSSEDSWDSWYDRWDEEDDVRCALLCAVRKMAAENGVAFPSHTLC